jgi:hypothetical protein
MMHGGNLKLNVIKFQEDSRVPEYYGVHALSAGPVAARSEEWVCGRSLAEIVGSNPTGGHGCLSVVCCQVEVSATG